MPRVKKTWQDHETCKYNPEVNCECKQCQKCGWNPEVEQQRKKEIRED